MGHWSYPVWLLFCSFPEIRDTYLLGHLLTFSQGGLSQIDKVLLHCQSLPPLVLLSCKISWHSSMELHSYSSELSSLPVPAFLPEYSQFIVLHAAFSGSLPHELTTPDVSLCVWCSSAELQCAFSLGFIFFFPCIQCWYVCPLLLSVSEKGCNKRH